MSNGTMHHPCCGVSHDWPAVKPYRIDHLPDQPDALREALERLVAAVGKAQGRPPTGATNSPNPWAAVADAMRAARAALATSAAAGERGDHEHEWITAALSIGKGGERYEHYCSICHAVQP